MTAPTDTVKLNGTCRALLAHLATSPADTSQAALCAQLQCSRMTVTRAVARLVAARLVIRQRQDAGFGRRLPDAYTVTPQGHTTDLPLRALTTRESVQRPPRAAVVLPREVEQLRAAMREHGLRAGFGNLREDVAAELVRFVRTHGAARLVAEAKAQTWGLVRHVAAYLARWRQLRAPRRPACAFHPAQLPGSCPDCAAERAAAVPMPEWFREQTRGRRQRLALARGHVLSP